MATKIKLNKNTLRTEKQSLQLYQEFLPTLELRKQQLQAEVRAVQATVAERKRGLRSLLDGAADFAPMLAGMQDLLRRLVVIDEVVVHTGNVAGVKVPVFDEVQFREVPYSLLGTPPVVDAAVLFWKEAVSAREEIAVLEAEADALEEQLVKTTQRINLYEKVLIPETKENIRRIKVYLGDQQTAAVCRAKIAKGKLTRIAEAESARQVGG